MTPNKPLELDSWKSRFLSLTAVCVRLERSLKPYRGEDCSPERTYLCSRIAIKDFRDVFDATTNLSDDLPEGDLLGEALEACESVVRHWSGRDCGASWIDPLKRVLAKADK